MIKEFIINLEGELDGLEDITVTYSESEGDYVVRFHETLTLWQLCCIVNQINKVIDSNP
jgi:hypothetical protein